VKLVAIGVAVAVSAATAFAGGVARWRVVKQSTASGEFAVAATQATVNHPRRLAVRLKGNVSSGTAIWACDKGYSISSWHRVYSRAGLYQLPHVAGKDSCQVTASVGGSGRITVQILSS
jgi:hypothetical protein